MSKQTEALKMAVEVLEQDVAWSDGGNGFEEAVMALQACKEALEQPAPDWTCNDVDVTNCDAKTLEQFCRDNIRLAPFFAMLAGALKQPAQSACEECIGFNKQLAAENDELKRQNDALQYKLSEPWKPLQPAQEPVASVMPNIHRNGSLDLESNSDVINAFLPPNTKLYTHPAPSWQGLSDDEIRLIGATNFSIKLHELNDADIDFARAIETALKEKNGR